MAGTERQQRMARTESRHHLSGEESGRPNGNEHASDGMPSVAQVPTPGNHFLDDGQRDAMAMPKPSGPIIHSYGEDDLREYVSAE